MNDSEDDAADELALRYRSASAGDRSRPSQHTRDAIRAQARKAMTLRSPRAADEAALAQVEASPSANDSRWNMRAVAGLAVVGLAGILATQAFHQAPKPESSRVTIAAESIPAAPSPVRPDVPAPRAFPRNATESMASSVTRTPQLAATSPVIVGPPPALMPRELRSADVADAAAADRTANGGLRSESKATGTARAALAAPAEPEEMHLMGKVLVHIATDRRHVTVAVDENGDDAIHHLFLYTTNEIVIPASVTSGLGIVDYKGGTGLRVTLADSGKTFEFLVSQPAGSLQHYFAEKHLPMKDFEALLGKNEGCVADFDQCLSLAGAGLIRVP